MNRRYLFYIKCLTASCGLLLSSVGCKQDVPRVGFQRLSGQTMGTTYECTFQSTVQTTKIQSGVDSLLKLVNDVASTYIKSSSISQLNQSAEQYCIEEDDRLFHFKKLMSASTEVFHETDGYFDPTLMPLVNYWGFGYVDKKKRRAIDQNEIDNLLEQVGFNKITVSQEESYCLNKTKTTIELDFSAIAKGYGVDLIARYLAANASTNYYVNIGGEVVVQGSNPKGLPWTLGINEPDTLASTRDIVATVSLTKGGMASSGNYRNFYNTSTGSYAHTINPKTGMATPSNLLSVTIMAEDCATADAYATACMAMGYKKARELIESKSGLDGFFIHVENNKNINYYATDEFQRHLKIIE